MLRSLVGSEMCIRDRDEFVEDVFTDEDGQAVYQYGTEIRKLDVDTVTLKYLDDKVMRERNFPIYRTHHGPITHMTDGGKWVATKINWDPVNALQQSFL